MPNRMLRDTTDSERVNALTPNAEVLFYRLMMKADDYGSYYANVRLIKSNCYPFKVDTVRDADISRWMDELLKAGLIVVYMHAAKPYLRIINFGQRLRNKKKKFPDCPPELLKDDEVFYKSAAIGGKSPPEVEEETEEETEVEVGKRPAASTTENTSKREKLNEFFFRVAPHLKSHEITTEVSKFMNKYPDVPANKSGALINTWVANMNKHGREKNSRGSGSHDLAYDKP